MGVGVQDAYPISKHAEYSTMKISALLRGTFDAITGEFDIHGIFIATTN